jgi:hypothetical protein
VPLSIFSINACKSVVLIIFSILAGYVAIFSFAIDFPSFSSWISLDVVVVVLFLMKIK